MSALCPDRSPFFIHTEKSNIYLYEFQIISVMLTLWIQCDHSQERMADAYFIGGVTMRTVSSPKLGCSGWKGLIKTKSLKKY